MQDIGILAALIAGVWGLLLWLSIIVWVYRDIRERTRDLGLQVLAVFVVLMFFPVFNIPGLALYLMLRPRETLEEAYARSLEEEALLREIGDEGMCPSCRRFVERSWRICPFCATQLKDICSRCEQLLSFNWVACPYCGTERRGMNVPEPAPAVVAAAAPASPGRTAVAEPPTASPSPRPSSQQSSQRSPRRPVTRTHAPEREPMVTDDGDLFKSGAEEAS
ncbi:MAG: zinc ribbon domain-containing protein [Chloroflexota bacterium]|nr:zinc ribbon domain-containing protein [Chloroflexota bacterium]